MYLGRSASQPRILCPMAFRYKPSWSKKMFVPPLLGPASRRRRFSRIPFQELRLRDGQPSWRFRPYTVRSPSGVVILATPVWGA